MLPEHARAGVTHDHSDLLPPGGLITMHGAVDANGFLGAKAAAVEPDGCVIQQPLTLAAKRCASGMMVAAVTANHRRNRLPFPRKSFVGKARSRCPAWLGSRVEGRGPNGLWIGHR